MSQEYENDITVQYKNRKATLTKIKSPAMMEIFEVRDKFPDVTYPVVMEDGVNNNWYETQIYVSEKDKETNHYAMKMVIE